MKEYVLAVRSTGESFGIIYDDGEKRITGGEHMRTLGADIRSSTRGARPLGSRRADICDLTVFIMGEDDPAAKHVEMTGGIWVHIAQYKRQLMTCFKRLWMVVQEEVPRHLRPEMLAEDVLKALSLLPLAKIKFDLDVTWIRSSRQRTRASREVASVPQWL